jgi:hypothetical protein
MWRQNTAQVKEAWPEQTFIQNTVPAQNLAKTQRKNFVNINTYKQQTNLSSS